MKRKRIPVNKSKFFIGEMMTCCMCGKQEKSVPRVQSDWTVIEQPDDGKVYYICPDELPLNDKATKWDFARAYEKILRKIAELNEQA
jgi:hypothetical protein